MRDWWQQASNTQRIAVIAVLVVSVLYVVASVSDDSSSGSAQDEPPTASDYENEYGGEWSVYLEILLNRNCESLQQSFDIAAENNERYEGGDPLHRVTLGYMTAAQDRMEALGCFD